MLFSGSLLSVAAQATDTVPADTPYLLRFADGWQRSDGNSLQLVALPFTEDSLDQLSLLYSFEVPDVRITDTLFLYLEGVVWNAELSLDNRYLGGRRQPFAPWVIPIPPALLQACSQYQLRLHLQRGTPYPWHPQAFLALLNPPLLLTREQRQAYQKTLVPTVAQADTVAIVASYYREHGYSFSPLAAARNLQPVYKKGIRTLYFPFWPGREMLELCGQLGFQQIEALQDTHYLCLVNAYPYEARTFLTQDRFWLDPQGYRTADYGDAFYMGQRANNESPGLGLILMILFPLISTFLIKLLNPGFFQTQWGMLWNPKLHLMGGVDITTTNTGLLGILMLLKSLNLAIFLSLLIFYVLRENQWQQLNLLQDWSLLNQWFYQSQSLWQIFRRSLLLVGLWFLVKHLLLALLGWGFRIKNFLAGVMSLEVFAAFPLILVLSLPLALILFTQAAWGPWFSALGALLVVVYLFRRVYVFYVGLGRMFNFSSGVKFLYICALNLLPYMIWF